MAYPHVCGATYVIAKNVVGRHGLSPRVWGNLRYHPQQPSGLRPIPTCVGQPVEEDLLLLSVGAYPHVCGATLVCRFWTRCGRGLSPRVWGNLPLMLLAFIAAGPIPTCVGQPYADGREWHCPPAYPHVCGATDETETKRITPVGLSPRVWGNLGHALESHDKDRPIPTCVGQPAENCHFRHSPRAYPHVCGATNLSSNPTLNDSGLSPRVWGNRATRPQEGKRARPIPTCVGQPRTDLHPSYIATAYPHVCGATLQIPATRAGMTGLSPRVWGNRLTFDDTKGIKGPIPTCVGQPADGLGYASRVEAYPHVCGATVTIAQMERVCGGLSPRVWGNQIVLVLRPTKSGPIPTCVGQPNSAG